jgi:hypothetical protein
MFDDLPFAPARAAGKFTFPPQRDRALAKVGSNIEV